MKKYKIWLMEYCLMELNNRDLHDRGIISDEIYEKNVKFLNENIELIIPN